MSERPLRISIPSKGRLSEDSLNFLAACGLEVYKPNPRQYEASIPSVPELTVLFQRPTDIVISVRNGSVDFGITGLDVLAEYRGSNGDILPLHSALGFGSCTLDVIVPDTWSDVDRMEDLSRKQTELGRPLRVATKFPNAAAPFFEQKGLSDVNFIAAEGTLEIAPTIGYADLITDLVSTGTTLRDNHLKRLEDGEILSSQACLIANRAVLKKIPDALAIAKTLLEYFSAHLRAREAVSVFVNIRGNSPESIARNMFTQKVIGGLQGPTFSSVITRQGEQWYAAHLVVRKDQLAQAIAELRSIGGSGVVVAPVTYIFEEEPEE
ncbi:MAG: ATP phosphoribosyltransferase, partial [Anaerolineales bacterium]